MGINGDLGYPNIKSSLHYDSSVSWGVKINLIQQKLICIKNEYILNIASKCLSFDIIWETFSQEHLQTCFLPKTLTGVQIYIMTNLRKVTKLILHVLRHSSTLKFYLYLIIYLIGFLFQKMCFYEQKKKGVWIIINNLAQWF